MIPASSARSQRSCCRPATRAADEDGNGTLETTTVYIYDSDWNLLEELVWVDEATLTESNNDLVRQYVWDPVSQNELVQVRSMQRDGSGAYSIPFPAWAATDRRRDVVAMYYDLPGIQTGHARVRYSPYGVPEPVLAGDLNHDGVLNDNDRADLALTRASGQTTGVVTMGEPAWNPDADLNFDGVIDEDDALALSGLVNKGGESEPGELWDEDAADFLRGLPIGYAGMMHDPQLGAWLMRNRWHDPALGRFISRDPAGYVDGMSLYAYVSGNPLKYWDPFGLACEANWHHLLPQKFKKEFEKAGVDINAKEFGWLLNRIDHQKITTDWNKEWTQFFKDAADEGRKVTEADVKGQLAKMLDPENKKFKRFRNILARGAEPPVASYGAWGGVKDKDAAFKAARESTADTVRRLGGKSGRFAGKAAKGLAKKLPVISSVFFIAAVANGENVGVAAANTVLIVDVDTIKYLGDAGQQYASDVVDSRASGYYHGIHRNYGPKYDGDPNDISDIIRQYEKEEQ